MSFVIRHKFILIFIALFAFYWYKNPPHRIGFAHKGIAVYNRIPVTFFDLYIGPDQKLHIEDNLGDPLVINNWIENQLHDYKELGKKRFTLFLGTGFDSTPGFKLSDTVVNKLYGLDIHLRQSSSRDAIRDYNACLDSGYTAALLLKVK
jgi:hypothetical protein